MREEHVEYFAFNEGLYLTEDEVERIDQELYEDELDSPIHVRRTPLNFN